MKKAVVFDNSGTLIERYRVIKDVLNAMKNVRIKGKNISIEPANQR